MSGLIQAGTKAWLTLEFYDQNGDPVVPQSITYDVYCITTDTLLTDDASVSPATSVQIVLTATDTAMQSAANNVEKRRVCVTVTYGASDSRIETFEFRVLRPGACS